MYQREYWETIISLENYSLNEEYSDGSSMDINDKIIASLEEKCSSVCCIDICRRNHKDAFIISYDYTDDYFKNVINDTKIVMHELEPYLKQKYAKTA